MTWQVDTEEGMLASEGVRWASSARLAFSLLLIYPTLLASCTSSLLHQPLGLFAVTVADGHIGLGTEDGLAVARALRFEGGLVGLLRGGRGSAQNGGGGSAARAGTIPKGRDGSSDCRDSDTEGRRRAAGSEHVKDSQAGVKGESSKKVRSGERLPVPVRDRYNSSQMKCAINQDLSDLNPPHPEP